MAFLESDSLDDLFVLLATGFFLLRGREMESRMELEV